MNRVSDHGGWCIKAERLKTGFPDRLILGPGRVVAFVETKAPEGRLSPAQRYIHGILARLGWPVSVPRSYADVEAVLRDVFGEAYRP